MPRWIERVDELLYDGEEVRETVEVGAGGVVVTSHRVLAFTPDRDGANFASADRPNVVGLAERATGDGRFLELGVKAVLTGAVMLIAGLVIDLDGLLGGVALNGAGAGNLGIGGVLEGMQSLLSLLTRLDDLLVAFGGLALVFGLVPLAVYVWGRERELVVEVAGDDDDLRLSAPDDEAALDRLRDALFPDGVPDPGSDGLLERRR
ncbi:MAG: hypothetical protein ABEJ89_01755 [Haloarculaceae archaeon]